MKCGKPIGELEEYCGECIRRRRSFCRGRGVFLYNTRMKKSLMRYKYQGCREYGQFYAESICRYVGEEILRWNPDVIVPVPLSGRRYRMRGFNQAADLAEKTGMILQVPVAPELVSKVRETKSQKKLDAVERRNNLKNAFYVEQSVKGLTILIMDDVYTTGSTVETLAECLVENGAEAVFFVTLCIGQSGNGEG
ncbi:ComF family protein [Blautia sp. MSJ-19]|nr:ComF family protein [Blautia sp. MSJ-19]